MPFNTQLKRYRNEIGMTQQQFADKLNITLRAYQNYEQGTREPSYDILIRIAKELRVSIDELLCYTKEE